jgi:hypothetical protein
MRALEHPSSSLFTPKVPQFWLLLMPCFDSILSSKVLPVFTTPEFYTLQTVLHEIVPEFLHRVCIFFPDNFRTGRFKWRE